LAPIEETMKQSLIILILLAFVSCNTKKPKINNENKIAEKDSDAYLTNKLVGDWGISVEISEGIETSCNSCPKVKFETNGKATVSFPAGDNEVYKWSIKGKRLVLTLNENKNLCREFCDSEYEMKLSTEKDFVELKLTDIEKKGMRILRK
jgi:hypothetical protein